MKTLLSILSLPLVVAQETVEWQPWHFAVAGGSGGLALIVLVYAYCNRNSNAKTTNSTNSIKTIKVTGPPKPASMQAVKVTGPPKPISMQAVKVTGPPKPASTQAVEQKKPTAIMAVNNRLVPMSGGKPNVNERPVKPQPKKPATQPIMGLANVVPRMLSAPKPPPPVEERVPRMGSLVVRKDAMSAIARMDSRV